MADKLGARDLTRGGEHRGAGEEVMVVRQWDREDQYVSHRSHLSHQTHSSGTFSFTFLSLRVTSTSMVVFGFCSAMMTMYVLSP